MNWMTGLPHMSGMYVWRIVGRKSLGLRTLNPSGDVIKHGWIDGDKEPVVRSVDVEPLGIWHGTEWVRVAEWSES